MYILSDADGSKNKLYLNLLLEVFSLLSALPTSRVVVGCLHLKIFQPLYSCEQSHILHLEHTLQYLLTFRFSFKSS